MAYNGLGELIMDQRKTPLENDNIEPHMCSLDHRLEILAGLPFFQMLSPAEIETVNRSFREQGFDAGSFIYYEGDPAERLYVIAAGKVKLLRHTMSGKEVVLDLLVPGEFFGSLSTQPGDAYSESAQAQTMVCALGIDRVEFRRLLDQYPQAALKVLDILAGRLQTAHEMLRQVSAHSVEQRIAYILLRLAEKLGQPDRRGLLIQSPLSRDDLAEMTGTTTESASRVMSQFQREGLIESGRQWVVVKNVIALKEKLAERM
jgi:CRP-like cAMP-binding protein